MPRSRSLLPPLALFALIAFGCNDQPADQDTARVVAGTDTVGGSVVPSAGGSPAVVPDGTPAAVDAPIPSPGTPGTGTAPATGTATPPGDSVVGGSTATSAATASATAPVIPATPTAAVAPTPTPTTPAPAAPAAANARAVVPWSAGEKFTYDVRFGSVDVGDATMEVRGIEDVRGRDTYHTVFRVRGGTAFFKVDDRYESWIDVRTLSSLRHKQDIDEASYERERTFEIFPDRGVYRENQKPEQPTVAQPLDDGSFFYFIRTVPLEAGKTYTFQNYFRPDRNPVTIKVLRRERVQVPAGTFESIVIQPLIKTKGVFGEGGRAEIWLTDDSTRTMLQMKSKLKFGSLNLYLKQIRRPPATP
jgi:hypothetical protein